MKKIILFLVAVLSFTAIGASPAQAALGDEWVLNSQYSSRGLLAKNDGGTEFAIAPGSTSQAYNRPDIDQIRLKSDQCWHYRSPHITTAWTYPQAGPLTLRLGDRNLVFEVETMTINPWTLDWVCPFAQGG